MQINTTPLLDYNSVLLKPKPSSVSSRSQVDLTRTFSKHNEIWFEGVPLIAANMTSVGTISMLNALHNQQCMTALHKYLTVDQFELSQASWRSGWYSMGISESDFDKLHIVNEINSQITKRICIDIANGYLCAFTDFISQVRKAYPTSVIMAGNIVDAARTREVIAAGADVVKVGIGPGSVCTTRKVTGVGYPQLSAVIECAEAAHAKNALVCADGGCTTPGDIAKAFAGGADFVMLGGMLAGHNECEGQLNNNNEMEFYGMSSDHAMHQAGIKQAYRSSEGKLVQVPFRGSVDETVNHILGGLRSCCTYTNSTNLVELHENAEFVLAPNQYNTVFGE